MPVYYRHKRRQELPPPPLKMREVDTSGGLVVLRQLLLIVVRCALISVRTEVLSSDFKLMGLDVGVHWGASRSVLLLV